jgi:hypothetical protein
MNPKILLIASGILLLVGAALPWATVSSDLLGVSRTITGFESDGILSGPGGLILLLIGIFAKGKPGEMFSPPGFTVTILCGFVVGAKLFTALTYVPASDITISLGSGLGIFSPLGVVLGFLGSVYKGDSKTIPGSVLSTSTQDVSTEIPPALPAESDATDSSS